MMTNKEIEETFYELCKKLAKIKGVELLPIEFDFNKFYGFIFVSFRDNSLAKCAINTNNTIAETDINFSAVWPNYLFKDETTTIDSEIGVNENDPLELKYKKRAAKILWTYILQRKERIKNRYPKLIGY